MRLSPPTSAAASSTKRAWFPPKLMQVLVDLVRDELEGIGGEWESLGEAAKRVVDRVDPAKR